VSAQDSLTKAARGQPCLIRLPGCSGGGEDTVACHYRLAGLCGIGLKPPSWMTAWGCAHCHSIADGREFLHDHSRDRVRLALAEAVFRTQAKLFELGLLKIGRRGCA